MFKRKKVPKRGPGVAELEKILCEQENKDTGFSSCVVSSSLSTPPYSSSNASPESTSLNTHVGLVPYIDHFSPPPSLSMTASDTTYSHGSSSSASVSLAENALFPVTWGSCKSTTDTIPMFPTHISNPVFPSPYVSNPKCPVKWGSCKSTTDTIPILPTHISNASYPMCPSNLLQRKNYQYSSMMVNPTFPGSSTPSMSTPLSAGLNHLIELPSIQRSGQSYTCIWPEEEKVVLGMKKPKPFSVDNSPGPLFPFQVPPMIDPRMARENQSSSSDNRGAFVLYPSNTISRDTRWHDPLDINTKKCITDYGASHNNMYTFGCPVNAIASPVNTRSPEGGLAKFDWLPFQESMEVSHQRSGQGCSDGKRPFHGLPQSMEQMGSKELTLSLSNERGEAEGDDIDLSLKL